MSQLAVEKVFIQEWVLLVGETFPHPELAFCLTQSWNPENGFPARALAGASPKVGILKMDSPLGHWPEPRQKFGYEG